MEENRNKKQGGFLKEFFADAFDLDHGLLKTFVMLFRNPREVMQAYLRDEIENYYSPFKYVVITTALMTFVFFLAFDFETFMSETIGASREAYPRMEAADTEMAKQISENANVVFQKLSRQYATISMLFLLMPSTALISYLFFKKKMQKYSNHFALSAYFVGQVNCIQIFLSIPLFFMPSTGEAASVYIHFFDLSNLIYMTFGLIRIFEVKRFADVMKAIFAPVFGFVLFALAMMIITIIVAFTMYYT